MLTFLSPCHRCSVLRQLGCKDGKNWNSKYVISWYVWHKINNTLLSIPTTRCIRIHCSSQGRPSAICLFSLKLHIFVSKLLIDSYLDKTLEIEYLQNFKKKGGGHCLKLFFQMMQCVVIGHLEMINLFPSLFYSMCEGVLILHPFRPMHRKH